MNVRTISFLAGAAVALAVAAYITSRPSSGSPAAPKGELFPGLVSKVNDVHALTVQSKGLTFTVEKKGDAWVLADKGGYPANFDKVRELVNQIAFFKVIEKKTDKPERFKKLELENPDVKDSASSQVTLKDASGAVLADVLIGKTAPGGGPTLSSLYARKAGDNQAYEVSGRIWIDGTALNWLDKSVLKVERTRVHRTTITHPDGTKLEMFKQDPDDKNFTLVDMPAGAELKWPGVADGTAGALEYMNFEDVEAAGAVDFNDSAVVTTRIQTFDGLIVTVRLLEKDSKQYAKFEAAFDPAARVEVTKIIPPPPPAGLTEGETPPPAEPTEEKKVPGKTAEEVEKEAKELSEKLAPWTYVIPGYGAANFTKKMSDMLKEATPAGPPEGIALPPEDGHEGHDHGDGTTATPLTPPIEPPIEPPTTPPATPPADPPATPPAEPPATPPSSGGGGG